jgi:hypothetical protein
MSDRENRNVRTERVEPSGDDGSWETFVLGPFP